MFLVLKGRVTEIFIKRPLAKQKVFPSFIGCQLFLSFRIFNKNFEVRFKISLLMTQLELEGTIYRFRSRLDNNTSKFIKRGPIVKNFQGQTFLSSRLNNFDYNRRVVRDTQELGKNKGDDSAGLEVAPKVKAQVEGKRRKAIAQKKHRDRPPPDTLQSPNNASSDSKATMDTPLPPFSSTPQQSSPFTLFTSHLLL